LHAITNPRDGALLLILIESGLRVGEITRLDRSTIRQVTSTSADGSEVRFELLGERKVGRVLADKGYDSQAILDHIEAMGAVAVVPSKSNRKQQRTHDKVLYRQRNRIERCFSRLKHFRRFATRYEKLKQNFKALVALACSWLHLQLYVDTA
jgi:transposase